MMDRTLFLMLIASGLCFQLSTAFAPSSPSKRQIILTPHSNFIYQTYRRSSESALPKCRRQNSGWQLGAKTDEEKEEEERKKKVREDIFWAKQRALAAEMEAKSDASLKK